MPRGIKGSGVPKPPKAEPTPRICEVCGQSFMPRRQTQITCSAPACKKVRQAQSTRASLARKAAHSPTLPWATTEVCALIRQAISHPTACKQHVFYIVHTEGYGGSLAIQLAQTAGESGRPVPVSVKPERVVVIGRLMASGKWALRAAPTRNPQTQEAAHG